MNTHVFTGELMYRVVDGISYEKLQPHHKEGLVEALTQARTVHNHWPLLLTPEQNRELARQAVEKMNDNWARTDYCVVAIDTKTKQLVGYHVTDDFAYFDPSPPETGSNEPLDAYRQLHHSLYGELHKLLAPFPPKLVIRASLGVGVLPAFQSRGVYLNLRKLLREILKIVGFQYELGIATTVTTFKTHTPHLIFSRAVDYDKYQYNGKYPLRGVLTDKAASLVMSNVPEVKETYKLPEAVRSLHTSSTFSSKL